MYPRNAASPERIAIGAVVQISDGTVQTSGVSVKVAPQGGAASAGGGTTAYEEGIVHYLPTQAETNHTSFMVIAYKTGCLPVSQTIITSASATAGKVVLSGETHTSAVIPTVTTLAGHTAQTGDCYARLGAPAGASVSADVAAVKAQTAAIETDTAEIGAAGAGLTALASASNLATVAGYLDTEVAAIKAKTDNLPSDPADQSAIEAAITAATSGLATATALATVDDFLDTEITDIRNRLPAALVDGRMDVNMSAIGNDTAALTAFKRAVLGNVIGTCDTGSSTTSIVTSSLLPAASVTDQYKGRIVIFDKDTTTAALRGQGTDITGSTSGGVLTVTALTNAPASGDTFTIT